MRELQQYLATNASIYPAGLVTGYFGPLTRAAVERFQSAQGIVSSGTPATTGFGRVGPTTMARINALNAAGATQNNTTWDSAPFLSGATIQTTNSSATITFTTNEATMGQIYYDVYPLQSDEATGPHQQPYVSETLVSTNGGYQINHSATINGLQANTTYYFLTRAIDSGNNLSMTWPSSFKTN